MEWMMVDTSRDNCGLKSSRFSQLEPNKAPLKYLQSNVREFQGFLPVQLFLNNIAIKLSPL